MSDSSQGPGWWQASDGKWYPPESHPDHAGQATSADPGADPSGSDPTQAMPATPSSWPTPDGGPSGPGVPIGPPQDAPIGPPVGPGGVPIPPIPPPPGGPIPPAPGAMPAGAPGGGGGSRKGLVVT